MRGGHFVYALCFKKEDKCAQLPNIAYVSKELAEYTAKSELPKVYNIKSIWVPTEESTKEES